MEFGEDECFRARTLEIELVESPPDSARRMAGGEIWRTLEIELVESLPDSARRMAGGEIWRCVCMFV